MHPMYISLYFHSKIWITPNVYMVHYELQVTSLILNFKHVTIHESKIEDIASSRLKIWIIKMQNPKPSKYLDVTI